MKCHIIGRHGYKVVFIIGLQVRYYETLLIFPYYIHMTMLLHKLYFILLCEAFALLAFHVNKIILLLDLKRQLLCISQT
jgi:hypothetical protein